MTQPIPPGIQFNGPSQNVRFSTVEQNLANQGANPLAPPPAPAGPGLMPDGGIDFAAVQEREAERAVQRQAVDPEQARLEAEHGQLGTAGTQFARGALSALLAPGVIVGAASEAFGALSQQKWLEDFGRDLGKASTGRSALEALGALGSVATGEEATTVADRARMAVDEQERAWPLLSTLSQAAGGIAFGVGTGGLASGGALGAKTLAAVGAYEGAAAGAQAAYDADAPITEVWTSALMGGTIGAGLAYGGTKAVELAGKAASRGRESLAKVFSEGEALGEFGTGRVAKALGFTKRLQKKYGEEEVFQIARDIDEMHLADGTPVFPKSTLEAARMDKSDIAERVARAHDEVGAEIGSLRARASKFIDEQMPEMRPSPVQMAARIDSEVVQPLASSVSQSDRNAARYIAKQARNLAELGDTASLETVVAARQRIGAELGDKFQSTGAQTDAMKRLYGLMQDDLAVRFERAAEGMGEPDMYRTLNRRYTSLERAMEAMEDAVAGQHGNNFLGLSSNIVMAGTLVGDMVTGGGVSLANMLAAGIGHKLLQERGPQVLAALARSFRRTPAHVDITIAGGREAQEALTEMVRARKFIQQTGGRAGPNPSIGAVAENTAQEAVAKELARRSGGFDPKTWATAPRAPSPLARVLYRSQILDTVAQDLAPTIERSVTMRPSVEFDIDPAKLSRLVKGADGPQAIGNVQAKVREIAGDVAIRGGGGTASSTDPLLATLQTSLDKLDTADVADAFTEAHGLVRQLRAAGNETDAQALAATLADDVFGEAGKAYRRMLEPPNDILRGMADPKQVRDALKTLELRGQLSQQIADEHRATLAAYEARKKLTGESVPPDVRQQMRDIERMWSRGEEAVTLDGARLGRIKDHLDNMTDAKVQSRVPQVPEEQQVAETMKGALGNVVNIIRGTGRVAARSTAPRIATAEHYQERLEQLSRVTVQPDTEERTAAVNAAPAGMRPVLVSQVGQKLSTLMQDLPKPRSDIRGPSYSSLSSDDIRRGNAMIDATLEPLSVFDDFARGAVDPDKVAYAWKQYPGLKRAAQLGTLDILQSQLSDDERSALPEPILTQLDSLLGFGGTLQGTIEISFSQRMSSIGEQLQQANGATPPAPSRMLQLPKYPSLTERMAGMT